MGLGAKLLARAIARFIRSGAASDVADRLNKIKYKKKHPEEAKEGDRKQGKQHGKRN